MANPIYFVRTTKTFTDIPSAQEYHDQLSQEYPGIRAKMELGYYMEQPQYKSWVPTWLIRFIKKHLQNN